MLDLEQIQKFYPEELRPFRTALLREYLQHKILEFLYRSPYASRLAFMGGTCIHLVHGSPRFSEDLDFDNLGLSTQEFAELSAFVSKELQLEGYTVEMKTSLKDAYHAYFRFPSILYESGLTGHRQQKLLIQVDTEPQDYPYGPEVAIINKFDVFSRVRTVPADILLSQKYACIITRPRPMGRDFYDAAFLMGKINANLGYIQEKLAIADISELKETLLERCAAIALEKLAADIEPFLIRPRDAEKILLFRDLIADRLNEKGEKE